MVYIQLIVCVSTYRNVWRQRIVVVRERNGVRHTHARAACLRSRQSRWRRWREEVVGFDALDGVVDPSAIDRMTLRVVAAHKVATGIVVRRDHNSLASCQVGAVLATDVFRKRLPF